MNTSFRNLRHIIFALCAFHAVAGARPFFSPKEKRVPTRFEMVFDQLAGLQPDWSHVATVRGLTIQRDVASFRLDEGTLSLCEPINDSTRAFVFKGAGRFRFAPSTDIERDQVRRTFETELLDVPFDELLVVFADGTGQELHSRCEFRSSDEEARDLARIFPSLLSVQLDADEHRADPGILKSLLESAPTGLYSATIRLSSGKMLMFVVNPFEEEEISLWRGETSLFGTRVRPEVVSQFRAMRPYRNKKEYISVDAYNIHSVLDESLEYRGEATLAIRANEPGHTWAPFFLTPILDVDSITTQEGRRLSSFRGKDNSLVWVHLSPTLTAGTSDTLHFYSHGELITNESGFSALRSSIFWYPRPYVNSSSMRGQAAFDLTYAYQQPYRLVSVGTCVSSQTIGETQVDRWISAGPIRNASFAIAKFEEFRLQEADLPPIKIFKTAYAEHEREKDVAFDVLNSVRFFKSVFGPCPFDSLYVAEVPTWGGEAFPGLIHLSLSTFLEGTTNDAMDSDILLRAHEVAHQWWGIALDFRSYRDQWLSEGFAQYSCLWYAQARLKDNERFFKPLLRWKSSLLNARKYLFETGQALGPVALGYRNETSETTGDHSRITYQKSAWVLHMLRSLCLDIKTMRDDQFITILREFYSAYRWKRATTRDFQRTVERVLGQEMSWFFNQWVYGTDIPTYTVETSDPVQKDGKYEVTLRVTAKGVSDAFIAPVIVLIDYGEERYSRARITVKGKETTVTLPSLPLEPKEVIFNDIESVLCEID